MKLGEGASSTVKSCFMRRASFINKKQKVKSEEYTLDDNNNLVKNLTPADEDLEKELGIISDDDDSISGTDSDSDSSDDSKSMSIEDDSDLEEEKQADFDEKDKTDLIMIDKLKVTNKEEFAVKIIHS